MTKAETNRKYWQRRFLQVKASQLKNTEEYERALQPELNGLRKQLQGDIAAWTTKYANSNGMTKDEAKKSLDGIKTKDWNLTLKQFEAKAKKGGYEDELNSEYYRSRIARLRELEGQLKQHTSNFAGGQTKSMGKALADQYNDTYMRSTFNTQMAHANITSNFARFSPEQLQMVASKPWKGSNFSQRIWSNYRDKMPSLLMNHLLKGTLLGYSPDKITRNIHAGFQDIKRNDVHRLAVSEMGHIAEEASAKAYEENEIEKYEYMATLESHTCEICGALDGLRFAVKDRKPGVNYPIIHPRCRCTTVPYMDDLPDVNERWSRDPETGKGKMVKNIKFDDWKAMVNGDKPIPEIVPTKVVKLSGIKDSNPDYSNVTTGNVSDDDQAVIKDYYQGGAYDVNNYLREGGKVVNNPMASKLSQILDNNEVKAPTTVYRKVNSGKLITQKDSYYADNPELAFPDLKVGDTFTDKGFMSTSKSNNLERFNPDSDMFEGDTELVIKLPKGVKALDLQPIADKGLSAGYESEQEVLLQHGLKLKVTSIENKPLPYEQTVGRDQFNSPITINSVKVIHMEAVAEGKAVPKTKPRAISVDTFRPKPITDIDVKTASNTQLRTYLKDNFSMEFKETSRTKLSTTALRETVKSVGQFKDLYQALTDKIPTLRALPKSEAKNAIAWYSSYRESHAPIEFGVNVKYFDNEASLKQMTQANVDSKWFSNNADENHVMIHEFSHHIDGQLSKLSDSSFSADVFQKMAKDGVEVYTTDISRYAVYGLQHNHNYGEPFAEIMAEAYGPTPRPQAIRFKKYFEEMAMEVLNNARRA